MPGVAIAPRRAPKVLYKGIPQAVPAAIAGEVQLTFSGAASSIAHIKGAGSRRSPSAARAASACCPRCPPLPNRGFPEVPSNACFGLFAPAGMPREVMMKLHAEVSKILREPEINQREVLAKGYDLVASIPGEFTAFLVPDSQRNARAVKISGAKAE